MKRTLLACLIALASSSAFAEQQRAYPLNVTTDEANIILNKLGEMPWKDANPLMSKLIGQLNEQNKPAPPTLGAAPLPPIALPPAKD